LRKRSCLAFFKLQIIVNWLKPDRILLRWRSKSAQIAIRPRIYESHADMKKTSLKGATSEERRKARLAKALRNNLALRKARGRTIKSGEDSSTEDLQLENAHAGEPTPKTE
jgi:hypothetical protein